MPVSGLPDTLEKLLATLQDQTGLSSWKICSQDPNTTTVVLRFTGQPLEQVRATRFYRSKCPSQRRRDQARQQAYITENSSKGKPLADQVSVRSSDARAKYEAKCSQVDKSYAEIEPDFVVDEKDDVVQANETSISDCSPVSPSGLFAPSPTEETMQKDCGMNSDSLDPPPFWQSTYLRSNSCDQLISSVSVSAVCADSELSCIDLNEEVSRDNEISAVEHLARAAGFEPKYVQSQVAAIINRDVQASLRNKSKNRDFHRVVDYQEGENDFCCVKAKTLCSCLIARLEKLTNGSSSMIVPRGQR
jgi:hypothetical protein